MTQQVNVIADAVEAAGILPEHRSAVTAYLESLRQEATALVRTMYMERMETQTANYGNRNYFQAIASAAFGNGNTAPLTYRSLSWIRDNAMYDICPGVTDGTNPAFIRGKDPLPFRFIGEAPVPAALTENDVDLLGEYDGGDED